MIDPETPSCPTRTSSSPATNTRRGRTSSSASATSTAISAGCSKTSRHARWWPATSAPGQRASTTSSPTRLADFPAQFPRARRELRRSVAQVQRDRIDDRPPIQQQLVAAGVYRSSRLRGNFEGFFREDNGQSDPGITSLYDFPTNDPNFATIGAQQFGYQGDIRYPVGQAGPLPLDRPHQLKIVRQLQLQQRPGDRRRLNMGSGKPLTSLDGAVAIYDNDRRVPMTAARRRLPDRSTGSRSGRRSKSQFDLQASYALNFGRRPRLTLLADAFNLFNLRRAVDYNDGVGVSRCSACRTRTSAR